MLVHRTLLALAGRLRAPVAAGAAIGLLVFAARVAQAALVGVVLARILGGGGWPAVGSLVLVLAAIVVLRGLLVWARDVVAQAAAEKVKTRLRDRLYTHLLRLGPGHLTRVRTGDVQATVVDGVEALEAYYSRYLPHLVVCLIGPVVVVGWMLTRDAVVGGIVLVAILVVPFGPRLWDRILAERGHQHWDAYSGLGADYLDAMQGMTTLKSFDAAGPRRAQLADRAEHLSRSTMRQLAVSLIDTGLTAFGTAVGVALAVGVGAVRVASGDLDLAALLVLLVLTAECFRPFQELSAHWHSGFLGVSAAEGIASFLRTPSAAPDPPEVAPLPAGGSPTIAFENVTYSYPGRDRPALRDLSFRVEPGQTVAIVGRSGAGKSTLVNLLLRFVLPGSGHVTVGGADAAALSGASVRSLMAVVSQDTYLFHATVAENLRLADADADKDRLRAALRTAGADGFVRALPAGAETVIGERGATLSGGQRQRLALARALVKQAPILVLDEATSAVDAENEARILAAMERAAAGRTTLMIAHRLNTVRHADRILVLADGALVESGSHDELLAADGVYARLVAAQRTESAIPEEIR